ncbi:BON domain-containing protein, partial [Acinetobacter baumannii]|uniref:BON domain-containing protein n=1 Tax=Acinetobacter baumannii TaxID=470 RepID=UPI0037DED0BC
MGLFDFVKGIGKKNTAPAEPQAAPATPAEPSAQEIANKLLGLIKSLGLGVEGLSVTYNGSTDTAIIKGQVQSQADKEKIILIVGNVDHVAQVDDQMTVATPEPESKFYTVKSGDNLSKIASVHDKFHRTLILSGFCLLKIAKISLNSSFFPKPIKR